MRTRKAAKTYKQAIVNTVILAIILFMTLYLAVQLSRNHSTSVSTQRTHIVTDTDSVSLTGYIFRDEAPISSATLGVADYSVADGERVGVGQKFATLYPTNAEVRQTQSEINEINRQLSRLESGISGGKTVAELSSVNAQIQSSYYRYIDSVLDGNITSARKEGELLLGALVDYSVITGRGGAAESIADVLAGKKQSILTGIGSVGKDFYAEQSCYYFYDTDGYEDLFSSRRLDSLTPEALSEAISTNPVQYGEEVIGRAVYSPQWYLALPTDEVTALRFIEGKVYEISYSSDKTLKMTLERVRISESGDAYLLMSCFDLTLSSYLPRTVNVRILMDSLSGYRIPTGALTTVDGERGVYILIGTVVEFRRVTVKGEGSGYYIVSTYGEDAEENSVSPVPYLNVNDLIITSGNGLYDGKLLD